MDEIVEPSNFLMCSNEEKKRISMKTPIAIFSKIKNFKEIFDIYKNMDKAMSG
jgi:hypothetical protein